MSTVWVSTHDVEGARSPGCNDPLFSSTVGGHLGESVLVEGWNDLEYLGAFQFPGQGFQTSWIPQGAEREGQVV